MVKNEKFYEIVKTVSDCKKYGLYLISGVLDDKQFLYYAKAYRYNTRKLYSLMKKEYLYIILNK